MRRALRIMQTVGNFTQNRSTTLRKTQYQLQKSGPNGPLFCMICAEDPNWGFSTSADRLPDDGLELDSAPRRDVALHHQNEAVDNHFTQHLAVEVGHEKDRAAERFEKCTADRNLRRKKLEIGLRTVFAHVPGNVSRR